MQWTQVDVTVKGGRLHCRRAGRAGDRPIVLVHGFSDNGRCWEPVARALGDGYDILMPDMRGHGLSARVRAGDTVDMAADLAETIRSLGLERPVVCGHSMGAMVSYQLGVRFPEIASALVLEDPPWWINPPPAPDGESPFTAWVKGLAEQSLEQLLETYRRDHPAWPDELVRAQSESKKQLDPAIAEIMAAQLHAPAISWQATLADLAVPLLLLVGNPDLGGLVTAEAAARVRGLHPGARVVEFPEAGHLIRFDCFGRFMDTLRGFLGGRLGIRLIPRFADSSIGPGADAT